MRGRYHRGGSADFTDWDNPEDIEAEDADIEEDEYYIPGPDDPDYDLSEAAGYAGWKPPKRQSPWPRWIIVAISLIMIMAILVPAFHLFGG